MRTPTAGLSSTRPPKSAAWPAPRRALAVLALALAPAAIVACKEDPIREYRTAKPGQESPAPTPAATNTHGRTATWTLPQGWREVKTEQPMRVATIDPGNGSPQIAISTLAGDAGGLLANVNRWREQMSLTPIAPKDLGTIVNPLSPNAPRVDLVELVGADGKVLLGAIIDVGDGATWFAKATGPRAGIDAIRPGFEALSRSFQRAPVPGNAGAETPPAPRADMSGAAIESRLMTWASPEHWKVDPKPSTFTLKAFDADGEHGPARITITVLAGNGGGTLANINRWRDQLGMDGLDGLGSEGNLAPGLTRLGERGYLADLASPDGSKAMLGAIIPSDRDTWYLKMTGAPGALARERAAFERLARAGVGE